MDINLVKELLQKDGIIFLTYGGFLSQALIAGMTEALEKGAIQSDMTLSESTNIFTIFIELAQNMMNYSKSIDENTNTSKSEGLIVVGRCKNDQQYYILSQNVVDIEDKEKIEPKLIDILSLDQEGIKKRYRELRKSGRDTHHKGGGIGFYEIAKRSDEIEYKFSQINERRFYFQFQAKVNLKIKEQ